MATARRLLLPPPRAQSLRDHRIAVWLDDPVAPLAAPVLDVLAAAVAALRPAGAWIDDSARPVDLAEADAVVDKLSQAPSHPEPPTGMCPMNDASNCPPAGRSSSARSTYS